MTTVYFYEGMTPGTQIPNTPYKCGQVIDDTDVLIAMGVLFKAGWNVMLKHADDTDCLCVDGKWAFKSH